jgi:hypothetical protein
MVDFVCFGVGAGTEACVTGLVCVAGHGWFSFVFGCYHYNKTGWECKPLNQDILGMKNDRPWLVKTIVVYGA